MLALIGVADHEANQSKLRGQEFGVEKRITSPSTID